MRHPDHLLIIDVEATCCDDGLFSREEMEVIEVGAVVIDPSSEWSVVAEFESMVRPVTHPDLTDFCLTLTGITQSEVDSADTFDVVYRTLVGCVGCKDSVWLSWGGFDRDIIHRECDRYGLDAKSIGNKHVDLSRAFTQLTGRRRGHRRAMKHFGIEIEGQHHRGLSDARNVAKLVPHIVNAEPRRDST